MSRNTALSKIHIQTNMRSSRENFSLKKNQWFKNALVSQVVLKTDLTILPHPEALLISAPLEVAISKSQSFKLTEL